MAKRTVEAFTVVPTDRVWIYGASNHGMGWGDLTAIVL